MNKRWIALAIAALAAGAAPSLYAQSSDKGDWIVRGRALYLQSDNKDSTGLDLSINNKLFPEVDFTYFFTPNFATELVLTYPQKQDLRSGSTTIGSFKHLPPTLTAQYHFTGMSWRPYVGAGLNYTMLSSVDLPAGVTVKKSSVGLAADIGADIPVGGGWLVNFDIKKVQIKTDVSVNGSKIGTLKLDPWLYSVGFGKRF